MRFWSTRLGARVDVVRRSLLGLRDDLRSPLPTVRVTTRTAVPAWAVRLLLVALGVTALVALQPGHLAVVVLTVVLGVLAGRPTGGTGAAWCLGCGVGWLIYPSTALGPVTFVLLAVVPAAYALASTVGRVPLLARIELAALRPALRRYLGTQLISQPLVAGAVVLRNRQLDLLPVAVAAAAMAAVLTWVVLPRLSGPDE